MRHAIDALTIQIADTRRRIEDSRGVLHRMRASQDMMRCLTSATPELDMRSFSGAAAAPQDRQPLPGCRAPFFSIAGLSGVKHSADAFRARPCQADEIT